MTDGAEGLRVLKILNTAQRALDLPMATQRPPLTQSRHAPVPAANGKRSSLEAAQAPGHRTIFVHETAIVDEPCKIGEGTKIWHFSHILSGSTIGQGCNIGQNVVVGPDVTIGKGCKIQNNVSVYQGVTLEDGVFCGPSMVFTNIHNPRAEIRKMDQVRPTLVKRGATIGANATLVCGITVGRYAFIGAGAVVNKNVSDHAIIVGNPGKAIGWMCECGERLTDAFACLECGKTYTRGNSGLERISRQDSPDTEAFNHWMILIPP